MPTGFPLPLTLTWILGFGLILGSFANACIWRWPREVSVMRGRSHCPHCDSTIPWHDNIPVLSWMWLGGRCRACRGPISVRYPLVELTSGGFFLLAALLYPGVSALAVALFLWSLIVVFAVDYDHRIIPDEVSYPFLAAGFLGAAIAGWRFGGSDPVIEIACTLWAPGLLEDGADRYFAIASSLGGILAGGGSLMALRIVGKRVYGQEAMGLGDVKLMAYVGAWLGATGALYALFAGSIIGAVVSLVLIARRRVGLRSAIPFGPFLALGAILALLHGRLS